MNDAPDRILRAAHLSVDLAGGAVCLWFIVLSEHRLADIADVATGTNAASLPVSLNFFSKSFNVPIFKSLVGNSSINIISAPHPFNLYKFLIKSRFSLLKTAMFTNTDKRRLLLQ